MKYILFLYVLLFSIVGVAVAKAENKQGDFYAAPVVCDSLVVMKDIAIGAMESSESANEVVTLGMTNGVCLGMPGPYPFVLEERVLSFTDYAGDDMEIWRVSYEELEGLYVWIPKVRVDDQV